MTASAVERQATGWTVDDATFGARLALIRMRMGWNMKEAARECGHNAQTWRLWEVDGVTPRHHVQVAKQISTRTGCDYLWLLLGPDRGQGGEGGVQLNRDYPALAQRLIPRRKPVNRQPKVRPISAPPVTPTPEHPMHRRPTPKRSANRRESVAA